MSYNTGWKNPLGISQYSKYDGKVGSTWSRRDKAKLDEPKSRRKAYDLSAVCYRLTRTQYSALMYIYDFDFNIPAKAVIKKVMIKLIVCQDNVTSSRVVTTLLKLKTGESTSDKGAGNNNAPSNTWITHRYAHYNGMQELIAGNSTQTVQNLWGVNLTPAMVNNRNFGCVFQCGGNGTSQHKAYVDSIQMYIEYDIPADTPTVIVKPEPVTPVVEPVTPPPYTIDTKLSAVKYNTLNPTSYIDQTTISQPYDNPGGYHFWIKYKNNAYLKNNTKVIIDQNSKPVIIETDGKLMFSGGSTSVTIPSQLIRGTSDSQYFKSSTFPLAPDYIEQFYDMYVFSTITDFNKYDTNHQGYIESTVKLYSTKTVNGKLQKDTQLDSITFKLNNTNSNIANSQTIIEDCIFKNNKSNKGAAIYNLGRLYVKNLKFSNNTTHGTGKNNCQFYDVNICRDGEYDT